MKARTMIYLDPPQMKALKNKARAQGISVAELIRRLVKQHLEGRDAPSSVPPEAYQKIIAMGSSGQRDVADRHDAYLAESLRREHAR